ACVEDDYLLMPCVMPREKFKLSVIRLLCYIYNRQGQMVWRSLSTECENIDYRPQFDGQGSEFTKINEINGVEYFVYDVEI
ncbi:histidine kinase, partial [Pseudomonas syringae pv. tagetis]